MKKYKFMSWNYWFKIRRRKKKQKNNRKRKTNWASPLDVNVWAFLWHFRCSSWFCFYRWTKLYERYSTKVPPHVRCVLTRARLPRSLSKQRVRSYGQRTQIFFDHNTDLVIVAVVRTARRVCYQSHSIDLRTTEKKLYATTRHTRPKLSIKL